MVLQLSLVNGMELICFRTTMHQSTLAEQVIPPILWFMSGYTYIYLQQLCSAEHLLLFREVKIRVCSTIEEGEFKKTKLFHTVVVWPMQTPPL
jgi:hypothetical protein